MHTGTAGAAAAIAAVKTVVVRLDVGYIGRLLGRLLGRYVGRLIVPDLYHCGYDDRLAACRHT